jgi:hypothetical protein
MTAERRKRQGIEHCARNNGISVRPLMYTFASG